MQSILIAEDNDEDFEAFQRVLSRSNGVRVIRCLDGSDVIRYLTESADEAEARPSVILLDLNMPGIDGRETLVRLKGNPSFRSIPTVVFSTSSSPKDVVYCYVHGANGYMNKPVNYMKLERNLRNFLDYWMHTMLLPPTRFTTM